MKVLLSAYIKFHKYTLKFNYNTMHITVIVIDVSYLFYIYLFVLTLVISLPDSVLPEPDSPDIITT